uniref:NADH-ubiquinone oxidoreductase chain 1 n=1 Tax=Mytilus trossulus TaxID=6551 RepID=A0A076JS29_MYTTR|nr:NADH dehydrogenase subunit 1 [Mytilus trossulus]
MNHSAKASLNMSNVECLFKVFSKGGVIFGTYILLSPYQVLADSFTPLDPAKVVLVDWVAVIVSIIPFVGVLLAVGFYTLLERKILAIIMIRKGPSKVSYMGILQPFSDAGKLLCKEFIVPTRANVGPFILAPALMLAISLLGWLLYPYKSAEVFYVFGVILFMVITSVSVYGVMMSGWASNSKYSLLGAVRAMAQSISYEIPMGFIFFCVVLCSGMFMFQEISVFQQSLFFFFLPLCVVMLVWMLCMLAETNRAPFDFVEGESELVSGYNVEYSGGGFAVMFIAEYSSILLSSVMSAAMFFGGNEALVGFFMMVFAIFFVVVRASLPRLRYDKLMNLCWTVLLCVMLTASVCVVVLVGV